MSVQDLPNELLLNILEQLDIGKGVYSSLLVCRRWNELSNRDACWRLRCIRKLGCPQQLDNQLPLATYMKHRCAFCPIFYIEQASWRQHAVFWMNTLKHENCVFMAGCTGHSHALYERIQRPLFNDIDVTVMGDDIEVTTANMVLYFQRTCLLKYLSHISHVSKSVSIVRKRLNYLRQLPKSSNTILYTQFLELVFQYCAKNYTSCTEQQICDYASALFKLGIDPGDFEGELLNALAEGHLSVIRIFGTFGFVLHPYSFVHCVAEGLLGFCCRDGRSEQERNYYYIMDFLYATSIWARPELLQCLEQQCTRVDWWHVTLGMILAVAVRACNSVFIRNVVTTYERQHCWSRIFWNYKHSLLTGDRSWQDKLRSAQPQVSNDDFYNQLLHAPRFQPCEDEQLKQLLFIFWIQLHQLNESVLCYRPSMDSSSFYNNLKDALGSRAFIMCFDCIELLHIRDCSWECPTGRWWKKREWYDPKCLMCAAKHCDTPIKIAFDKKENRKPFQVRSGVCPSKPTNCIVFRGSTFYAINISPFRAVHSVSR